MITFEYAMEWLFYEYPLHAGEDGKARWSKDLVSMANDQGKKGWEVCAVTNFEEVGTHILFKRAKSGAG